MLWAVKLRTRMYASIYHDCCYSGTDLDLPYLISGNMAWSAAKRTISVSNLLDGVDIYRLTERPFFEKRLLVGRIRCNVPQQVGFAQNGELVICGSDKGEVYVWDRTSSYLLRTLRHGGTYLIMY